MKDSFEYLQEVFAEQCEFLGVSLVLSRNESPLADGSQPYLIRSSTGWIFAVVSGFSDIIAFFDGIRATHFLSVGK